MEDNTVNAVVEEVVTPQETPEVVETTESVENSESVQTEVAPVTEEKAPQSKEENSKYAEVRRKAEQRGRDEFISKKFGEYGIHTEAEYDAAIAERENKELLAKLKEGDADPNEIYKQMKENDPEIKAMREKDHKTFLDSQMKQLNDDLKALGVDETITSMDDIAKLESADQIIDYVKKGISLSEAYKLANYKELLQKDRDKIQQETINKIAANGTSSPGSLSDTGETPSFFTREQVDAMSQKEVNKNLDLIHKSMKSW